MGFLSRLWFAMRTRNIEDAGTDDRITLIITEDGVEKLNHTFPDTSQDDQDRGKANLYMVDDLADLGIRSENLTDSSIQVAIKGKDFWFPEHVLIWGEGVDNRIIPLAAEWDIEAGISKDPSEGNPSFPVRRIWYPISPFTQFPDKEANISQILVVLTTADTRYADTPQHPELEITFNGGRTRSAGIRTVKMNELKRGHGFFSLPDTFPPAVDPNNVPRWNNLESVVLKIDGDEAWLPSSFSMFGFRSAYDDNPLPVHTPKPGSIMPLVHIPDWNLGRLSTDLDEGKPSVSLPLLPLPTIQPSPFDVSEFTRS